MGIVEECGEYHSAGSWDDKDDALADVVVFLADYCTCMGWDLEAISRRKRWQWESVPLAVSIGQLCHHHLKRYQGIRGDAAHHDKMGQLWAAKLWTRLCWLAAPHRTRKRLMALVEKAWAEVKQRDWRKAE
jgi:hypothetical protein